MDDAVVVRLVGVLDGDEIDESVLHLAHLFLLLFQLQAHRDALRPFFLAFFLEAFVHFEKLLELPSEVGTLSLVTVCFLVQCLDFATQTGQIVLELD